MNRNVLKYIAIVAMTLDHIGGHLDFIPPELYLVFKIIGRITMPVMCFFIVEGFKYTKDKRRYALRLFSFACISQLSWCLLQNNTLLTFNIFSNLNTIFTLLLGYLLIWLIESENKLYIKSICIILITACSFLCDYKLIGLIYIMFFYLFDKNRVKVMYLPVLYIISIFLAKYIYEYNNGAFIVDALINVGLLLTIPLFYLYNGKSGSGHKFHKYFFYIYYPVHLFVIFLINLLV